MWKDKGEMEGEIRSIKRKREEEWKEEELMWNG